jgi:hypothetical protein
MKKLLFFFLLLNMCNRNCLDKIEREKKTTKINLFISLILLRLILPLLIVFYIFIFHPIALRGKKNPPERGVCFFCNNHSLYMKINNKKKKIEIMHRLILLQNTERKRNCNTIKINRPAEV